jgi:predicted  nucleic acid-binding Zn-ribbon protein
MSLVQLWILQEIDLAIQALETEAMQKSLKEELQGLSESVERLEAELAKDEELWRNLHKHLQNLELELQKNTGSRASLRKRLYGGEVSNVRELEQMEIKLSLLEKEQSVREDEALKLMEEIEAGEQQLRTQSQKFDEQKQALQAKERQLTQSLERIEQELALLRKQQEDASALIDPVLLNRYHFLAQKHQGRAMARVISDICGGCRVFISLAQRGFLRDPKAMVYCENCGRLLVKFSEQNKTG